MRKIRYYSVIYPIILMIPVILSGKDKRLAQILLLLTYPISSILFIVGYIRFITGKEGIDIIKIFRCSSTKPISDVEAMFFLAFVILFILAFTLPVYYTS